MCPNQWIWASVCDMTLLVQCWQCVLCERVTKNLSGGCYAASTFILLNVWFVTDQNHAMKPRHLKLVTWSLCGVATWFGQICAMSLVQCVLCGLFTEFVLNVCYVARWLKLVECRGHKLGAQRVWVVRKFHMRSVRACSKISLPVMGHSNFLGILQKWSQENHWFVEMNCCKWLFIFFTIIVKKTNQWLHINIINYW